MTRILHGAGLVLPLALAVSCDAPVKSPTPAPPRIEVSVSPEAPVTPTPSDPVPPSPSVPDATPETEPTEPDPVLTPLLEVHDQGDRIVISGRLSSRFQAADIIDGITNTLPDKEIVDELETDNRIPEVRWGNRVLDLLHPLLTKVRNARFHYEDGITRLEGTVSDAALINQFQHMTISVMSDTDARNIENLLKAEEPAPPAK